MNVQISKMQFVGLMEDTSIKYDFTREALELMYDYYELVDRDIRFNAKIIAGEFEQYATKEGILKRYDQLKEEDVDGFIKFMGIIKLNNGQYLEHKRDF